MAAIERPNIHQCAVQDYAVVRMNKATDDIEFLYAIRGCYSFLLL